MSSKRDEYTKQMKDSLDDLNRNIDALEAKAHEAKEDAKEMYKAELKKLRAQSTTASNKLAELKSATEESWDNMVAEMEKIQAAFVHSYNYFKSQL